MNYFVYPGLMRREVTSDDVLNLVSSVTGVSTKQMLMRGRKREVVEARQITAHMLSTELKLTVMQIAKILYPSTKDSRNAVYNLLRSHESDNATDERYRILVNNISLNTKQQQQ